MEIYILYWLYIIHVLLLLVAANGMPVLARYVLGTFGDCPVDFGISFYDNRPLLGFRKTWRGLITAILATTLLAPLFGLSFKTGALLGMLAMVGDLVASFTKRRMGLVESSRFRIIDVMPESLLPVFILLDELQLNILTGGICVALFFVLEVILSPILFRLHIRKKPY